jgi:hypothetical protein
MSTTVTTRQHWTPLVAAAAAALAAVTAGAGLFGLVVTHPSGSVAPEREPVPGSPTAQVHVRVGHHDPPALPAGRAQIGL